MQALRLCGDTSTAFIATHPQAQEQSISQMLTITSFAYVHK